MHLTPHSTSDLIDDRLQLVMDLAERHPQMEVSRLLLDAAREVKAVAVDPVLVEVARASRGKD